MCVPRRGMCFFVRFRSLSAGREVRLGDLAEAARTDVMMWAVAHARAEISSASFGSLRLLGLWSFPRATLSHA